jgi:phosphinothricin acetyltransferase
MSSSIRLARESDAAAIAAIYRPIVESTAITFEVDPPSESEMRKRITDTLAHYPWLVYETEDQIAAYAYATRHRVRAAYQWSVDVSICVEARFRRWGIGRGLYTSLFGILAAQGFFNAYAGIALPNPASVALHESLGFQRLGVYHNVGFKLGAWRDVGWWQLGLRQHELSPAPPRKLADVLSRSDWPRLLAAGESSIRARAA